MSLVWIHYSWTVPSEVEACFLLRVTQVLVETVERVWGGRWLSATVKCSGRPRPQESSQIQFVHLSQWWWSGYYSQVGPLWVHSTSSTPGMWNRFMPPNVRCHVLNTWQRSDTVQAWLGLLKINEMFTLPQGVCALIIAELRKHLLKERAWGSGQTGWCLSTIWASFSIKWG